MLGCHHASSALFTLSVLLVGTSFITLSTQIPINGPGFDGSRPDRAAPPGLAEGAAGDTTGRGDEMRSLPKGEEGEEEDGELFEDMDPKTLAALLLEALNKPQTERRTDGGEQRERTEEAKAEPAEEATTKVEEELREAASRATEERENRDRDGRHELEQLMAAAAAQGKEERERQEEEERKRKQEEEERMTERVTSRTTSQTVQPVKTEQASSKPSSDGGGGEEAPPARPPAATSGDPRQSNEEEEEEEQLSPEEVQNLERMMKKFQSYSAATKRERDSQVGERESRGGGFSPYEHKGAMSKKKLKWQEETMKAMHVPTFKGGNFMDHFQDQNDLDDNTAQSPAPPPENDRTMEQQDEPEGEEEDEEEEEEEEVLSPAEEEARAKAEQEEVRRQAAEAQRAKEEEEKLADMASDMLLQYMVKQNGHRKYGKKKYSSSSPHQNNNNAAEDKRSNEEAPEEEEEDMDPQTIDKLIEISSKLHLPADDVVDIISDVEKKKKKDVALEMGGALPPPRQRQRPLVPMASSQSSINDISASRMAAALNGVQPSSFKQDPQSVNPLKAWFLDQTPPSRSSQQASDEDQFWTKSHKPLSSTTAQDFWLKPQKSFRASYNTPYSPYASSYYQQKPSYRGGYYPLYFPPPPPQNAKPRYYDYARQPAALSLDNLLGRSSSADYNDYNFGPKWRFRNNWVQVRPRKPPASLRRNNPYYADYVYSSYPRRTFQQAAQAPLPQLRSPPRLMSGGAPPHRRSGFYYRPGPVAPAMTRGGEYYDGYQRGNQADGVDDVDARLESYLQQILMKRPQMVQ